eukprot:Em0066g19a
MFQCPICEQNTSIPVGGASVFPRSLHLGFEVEAAGYMSKMTSNSDVACDQCTEGSSDPAVVFCCACHHFLCAFCLEHHKRNRIWSKHKIVGLDQEGARQLHTTMKPGDHYCSQPNHEDNKSNFYCETCSLLVCLHCTTVTHKSHSVKEISTVAKSHQMEISGALEEAKEVVTKLTGAIDENNRIIEQVEIFKRTAFLAINQAFEILQQRLEERKKTLLSVLEAISLSKTTALTLQKEQFEKMVGDIGHYTDMASQILQTHTDHEIVAWGGLIPTELQATLKRVQTISLTPNQQSNISVSVKTILVGTRYHVKVQSKTSKGEEYPHGGVEVKGEMRSKTHNGAVVYGEVEDHRDGTYTITLTPQTAGSHQLLITMDGQHVQNSPNDLDVRPKRDYRTLCNAQQVIQCNWPLCVAIHDNGDIYVGSYDNCIYVFDQTGQLINIIGSRGSGDGQFSYPNGISIKGDVLYVADSGNYRVQKLTSSGKFLHKFGHRGSGQGQFDWPVAVIIDSNNKLIVSDHWNAAQGSNTIKVFSKEGVYVRMYGDPNGPRGLAIDGEGYSLVSDNSGHCLSIYDPEGNKIHTVGNLNYPYGTALHPRDGSVFIANYGSRGSGEGQFTYPNGISIKGDVLYVADSGNHRVQKLTSSGKFLHKFGQQGSGQGQFRWPVGVFIDSNNKLIVSDRNNHRIQIYNENGGWLLAIDGNGSGNHCFQYPQGLALDPQGNIHVAAFGSNTIKVFSKEGVYVRMYGDPNGPIGLAIDDEGYSLVIENSGKCLSIYDPEGNKIHTVGNLKNPWGTALDPRDGSVFIANFGTNTVLKYCVNI